MPDDMSQTLIEPRFVRFHDGTGLAFAMLVVHEDPQEEGGELTQLSGYVFCNDEDNDAGLSTGINYRSMIGHGGPGMGASWSDFNEGGQE